VGSDLSQLLPLRFETRVRQKRLRSTCIPNFAPFDPHPCKIFGKDGRNVRENLMCFWRSVSQPSGRLEVGSLTECQKRKKGQEQNMKACRDTSGGLNNNCGVAYIPLDEIFAHCSTVHDAVFCWETMNATRVSAVALSAQQDCVSPRLLRSPLLVGQRAWRLP